MLRPPKGPNPVSITYLDTPLFGSGLRRRKLSLAFFYPAVGGKIPSPYRNVRYQQNAAAGIREDNGIFTGCFQEGALSGAKEQYPVVLYSHGLTGFQMDSTVLCADIASEGNIVVSVGHPFGSGAVTYTDGQVFCDPANGSPEGWNLQDLGKLWVEDLRYAIDQLMELQNGIRPSVFAGRLALSKGVHLLGVSFGGCCSVAAALQESRVIDAVNLDGSLFVDLDPVFKDKPILVLRSNFNRKAHQKLKNWAAVRCGWNSTKS